MSAAAPPPLLRPSLMARTLPGLRLRIGVLAILALLLIGFVSIVWTPYPVDQLDPVAQLQGPSAAHLLGTDALGRDLLSMVMKGILTSFVVAGVAVAIGLFIGVPLGLAASVGGVWIERLLLGGSGFFVSISAIGMAVVFTALFGASALIAMLAIGLFNISLIARSTHEALATFRGRDYIAASRLSGLGAWDGMRRHVLAGVIPHIGAAAIGQLAMGVLLEASLSFVGLGPQPPGSSLGLILRDAQSVMLFQPLLIWVPGIALVVIAVSLNLIAAGVRRTEANDAA